MFEIFSTRELSLLIWLSVFIIYVSTSKEVRQGIAGVIKSFFEKRIILVIGMLIALIFSIIIVLVKYKLWDISLLKDTIFWFFSVALVFFFSINKATDTNYFKNMVLESFKWTLILEFLINFYTFNLLTELIIIPFIIVIASTKAIAKTEEKYKQVYNMFKKMLSFIGFGLLAFVLYKTVNNYQEVFTIHNFLSLLLPIILTTLLMPFLYFVALYMNYEVLFIRIDFMTKDEKLKKEIKRQVLGVAHLDLNKLKRINKKLNKFDIYHSDDIGEYLRGLLM